MRLKLRPSPFLEPIRDDLLTERETILHRIEQCGDMDWAKDCVAVYMNGIYIPKAWWPYVTMKPEADGITEFVIVNQKGNLIPIVASVALIALTAGIGTFGVPFLGAGFAAGTFGASAVAAGVGIGGQIALRALTAPQTVKNNAQGARDLSQAGIGVNIVTKLQVLPVLDGKSIVSPPVLSPTYTTWDSETLTINAICGIQGRNLVEEARMNGVLLTEIENIEYEIKEGSLGDTPLTIAQLSCIQDSNSAVLSNFNASQETTKNAELVHQDDPDSDLPQWQQFKTKGLADEIWLRLLMPSGIVRSDADENATVPLRIEIRKIGDVTWRKLPTLHINDVRKGRGQLRVEVKLLFKKQTSGIHISRADGDYAIYYASNDTGRGETFQYTSDAYFAGPSQSNPLTNSIIPTMTAATTGTVTMSASSTSGANAAWKASDSGAAVWQVANNSLPAWIQIQFSTPQIARSYYFTADADSTVTPGTMPTKFYWSGSNDGVNFTRLDPSDVDISANPMPRVFGQIEDYGSYTYYRLNILANNGAANQQVNILDFRMFLTDVPGISLNDNDYTPQIGATAKHDDTNALASSVHVSLNKNGANIFLDPASWDTDDEYEVRVMRGQAFDYSSFTPQTYDYQSTSAASDFFTYRFTGGKYAIRVGQKNYRSDIMVETFSTVSYDTPVDTTGITCIAVSMPNTQIDTLSALMTSYAPIYSNGRWTEPVPTTNPAALYRRRKLGHAHPNPTDGEILDEDDLIDWYMRCDANGHECNFLHQGRSIGDVLSTIAFTGYAAPREANTSSIVQDYDRSVTGTNEPISQMLSPLNSRLLGSIIGAPDIEHAIIAEYLNEDDDYDIARETVYREGFDANTATFFTTISYEGMTNTAKVIERANFDIKQAIYRSSLVRLEVDIEGFDFWRGKLVGHNDETLYNKQATALIRSIQDDGTNITGITVDNLVPFAANQDDLDALMSGLDLSNATGVGIRLADDTVLVKTLTNVTDSKAAVFTTPFLKAGSGVAVGQLVVFGIATTTPYARMLVMEVEMQGFEKRILTLAPEAPELFQ